MNKMFCRVWTKDEFGKELTEKEWYLTGKRHREDGPALEYADGGKEWWYDGQLHREDGPAIEYPDGGKEWWYDGQLHREDGPAVIEIENGISEHWYINGCRHRADGPASIYGDGRKYWYMYDKNISDQVEEWIEENNIDIESEQGKLLFKLNFA